MLKSMTGYGKAVSIFSNKKISVELKSLNSKNNNLAIKLPELYSHLEPDIRNIANRALERGKINIVVSVENSDSNDFRINKDVVSGYYNQLKSIVDGFGHDVEKEQLFQTILRLPGVFSDSSGDVEKKEEEILFETLKQAISKLDSFRIQEGVALQKDIVGNVAKIKSMIPDIVPLEEIRIINLKKKLKSKIDEVLSKYGEDKNRFEQEIIYYLEKLDINEEKIRLANHCDYFIKTVKSEDSAGKKLGFISQEIGREINTLGSKANNTDIQKIVVDMKDYLEKVKEQLLNVL